MWYTILALVCAVLVVFWNPVFEHMTNADIQKKTEFHGSSPTKWEMPNAEDTKEKLKSKSTQKKADTTRQIQGPMVPPLDPNAPKPSSSNGKNGTSVYPEIYGPEQLLAPGHKDSSGALYPHMTTTAEFPAGPKDPQPYLADFSKILKG